MPESISEEIEFLVALADILTPLNERQGARAPPLAAASSFKPIAQASSLKHGGSN